MSPYATVSKGVYDEKTKTLTAYGEMPNMQGKAANHRFVERWVDANTREASIAEEVGDGKWADRFTFVYTRK